MGHLINTPRPTVLTARKACPHGAQLINKNILFRWPAVGWCLGKIVEANADGRRTMDGVKVNFFVYYEMDDDTSKHALSFESYGENDGWVLLERA